MIDLQRFTSSEDTIVPIVEGWGQVNQRKVFKNVEDGWYAVTLGNRIEVGRKATPVEVDKLLKSHKFLRVYALGTEGIPTNFDNFTRRGFGQAVKVHFLNLPLFEVAKVVIWEDKRIYFYETDIRYERDLIRVFKDAFSEGRGAVGVKGTTPEIYYYNLLITLQSQAFKEVEKLNQLALNKEEMEKRIKQFGNSFEARLTDTISAAGGKLLKFSKSNADTFMVEWEIGDQTVKTTIHDDMRILSAGYCLSGDDRKHTMASLVQLAKLFQVEDPLYITRD